MTTDLVTEEARFDEDLAECMKGRGFEMAPDDSILLDLSTQNIGYQSMVGNPDLFATEGYGITGFVIAIQVSELSEAQLDPDYLRALRGDSEENQGCYGETQELHPIFIRDFEQVSRREEFLDSLQLDLATSGVISRWQDCMSDVGLNVSTPTDLTLALIEEIRAIMAGVSLDRFRALTWTDGRPKAGDNPDLQERINRAEAIELRHSKADAECGQELRAEATDRFREFEADELSS